MGRFGFVQGWARVGVWLVNPGDLGSTLPIDGPIGCFPILDVWMSIQLCYGLLLFVSRKWSGVFSKIKPEMVN